MLGQTYIVEAVKFCLVVGHRDMFLSAVDELCKVQEVSTKYIYCRFGNFRENFIFVNSIKRHIGDVKNSRLRHVIPISINDRVILPFREDIIFAKLRICEVLRK